MWNKTKQTSPHSLRDTYDVSLTNPGDIRITPLKFWEHWLTLGHMYRNYREVDPVFERLMGGENFRFFTRWLRGPLYYWLLNRGYGLRLNKELGGQIYLQHKKFLTHINDVEINFGFRGRGYSHKLLDFAEKQARRRSFRYLTLGVTNSNTRAVNLYQKSGYLEQHHRFFYLSRPSWSEPAAATPLPQSRKVVLRPLKHGPAKINLKHFFQLEQAAADPSTAPVWEKFYQPHLPASGKGVSFAILFDDKTLPQGHADFFDWGDRGRWRIYLSQEYWGSEEEKALFEVLIHQSRGYSNQWFSVGSGEHHRQAQPLAHQLGLVERNGERMLMIKVL